jgi:hypothetical protein
MIFRVSRAVRVITVMRVIRGTTVIRVIWVIRIRAMSVVTVCEALATMSSAVS